MSFISVLLSIYKATKLLERPSGGDFKRFCSFIFVFHLYFSHNSLAKLQAFADYDKNFELPLDLVSVRIALILSLWTS